MPQKEQLKKVNNLRAEQKLGTTLDSRTYIFSSSFFHRSKLKTSVGKNLVTTKHTMARRRGRTSSTALHTRGSGVRGQANSHPLFPPPREWGLASLDNDIHILVVVEGVGGGGGL